MNVCVCVCVCLGGEGGCEGWTQILRKACVHQSYPDKDHKIHTEGGVWIEPFQMLGPITPIFLGTNGCGGLCVGVYV